MSDSVSIPDCRLPEYRSTLAQGQRDPLLDGLRRHVRPQLLRQTRPLLPLRTGPLQDAQHERREQRSRRKLALPPNQLTLPSDLPGGCASQSRHTQTNPFRGDLCRRIEPRNTQRGVAATKMETESSLPVRSPLCVLAPLRLCVKFCMVAVAVEQIISTQRRKGARTPRGKAGSSDRSVSRHLRSVQTFLR